MAKYHLLADLTIDAPDTKAAVIAALIYIRAMYSGIVITDPVIAPSSVGGSVRLDQIDASPYQLPDWLMDATGTPHGIIADDGRRHVFYDGETVRDV